jgi:hypothetical protein
MAISFPDLQLAFEFVSSDGLGENRAILDTQSGHLYYHSEVVDTMEEDEFPDDIGRRALDRWHDFSAKEEEAALRQWCSDNGIELVD